MPRLRAYFRPSSLTRKFERFFKANPGKVLHWDELYRLATSWGYSAKTANYALRSLVSEHRIEVVSLDEYRLVHTSDKAEKATKPADPVKPVDPEVPVKNYVIQPRPEDMEWIDDEMRMRDVALGRLAGMKQPRNIRTIIKNTTDLQLYGTTHERRASFISGNGARREVLEQWLTRKQCVRLLTKMEGEFASKATKAVIDAAFDRWEQEKFPTTAAAAVPAVSADPNVTAALKVVSRAVEVMSVQAEFSRMAMRELIFYRRRKKKAAAKDGQTDLGLDDPNGGSDDDSNPSI